MTTIPNSQLASAEQPGVEDAATQPVEFVGIERAFVPFNAKPGVVTTLADVNALRDAEGI